MMELIGYIGKETLNMAITYNEATQIFTLQTAGSTYQMMVGRYNILQHLYYGRKVEGSTMDYLLWSSDSGFSGNPYEAGSDRTFSLDIQPQEYPSAGVGDYRTSCIEVVNPDGTRAADFRYVSHEITAGAYKVTGMPAVYDENGESSTLTILMKDAATLDKMYELNKTYFKELSMYILAGKKKLKEVREGDLARITARAQQSGLPEDAQEARDLDSMCNRFEKKLHDLELTRMISIQTAPQIRLVQNNDTLMVEKIQSTLVNTIPLWKSQMVLALGVEHSTQAAAAQRQVTDMTNELLRKNAATLKTATIETAKESERGIVDMETLKITNESLISTLDDVMRIQQEGRQKRQEAEAEMARMENELKSKLLQISG